MGRMTKRVTGGAGPRGAARRALAAGGGLLLAGLGLLGLEGCAPVEPPPPPGPPPLEAVLARLPAEVAGFQRGAVQDVAPGDPGAGKVVEYITPRRVAVAYVFLYDLGRPAVTEADLPPEVERAVSEATALPSDRTGRQLSVASRSGLPAGGGNLSCAALDGSFGRMRVERQVCVGVAAGRFLRVQVTMPNRPSGPVADPLAFASGVAAAVRGG